MLHFTGTWLFGQHLQLASLALDGFTAPHEGLQEHLVKILRQEGGVKVVDRRWHRIEAGRSVCLRLPKRILKFTERRELLKSYLPRPPILSQQICSSTMVDQAGTSKGHSTFKRFKVRRPLPFQRDQIVWDYIQSFAAEIWAESDGQFAIGS